MAEAIGIASGLVGLATFACQCSVVLYKTVASFQSHQQRVHDLVEETSALAEVLQSLVDAARANSELQIPALAIPLKRCATACQEFTKEIEKFSSRSTNNGKTSFRDWARLRYMGDDIDGFRRLLSSYKMTINIALTNATLVISIPAPSDSQQSMVTSEAVQSYNSLLKTARADLEDRLEIIDDKLELMLSQKLDQPSSTEVSDVAQIREERQSTENSLQICAELSDHITRIQIANRREKFSAPGTSSPESASVSEKITNDGLQECKESLARMAAKLASHEKQLFDSLANRMNATSDTPDVAADIARLRDEWESARQSMNLVSSASHALENSVSIIENHATGDAVQFMVSTNGKILHGTNRGLGWRTRQVGGYIDAETVRQISRDLSKPAFHEADKGSPGEDSAREERDASFKERFGDGYKLPPNVMPRMHSPSKPV